MAISLQGNNTSTYSSDLSAADGTFSGDLTAADGTFTSTMTAAGGRAKVASDGNVELRDASNNLVLSLGATDGSASFADGDVTLSGTGDIKTGTFDASSNGVAGIELGVAGACSVQRVNGTANGATIYVGYRGNDKQFEVQATGQIYSRASTSITLIASERRLKRDIEAVDPVVSWETIRDLPYYQYKFIGSELTTYGPIVDECPQEMILEGVTEDEQGNIRTYDNAMLQSRLFVALQTALTRIEALEAEVQALKGGN